VKMAYADPPYIGQAKRHYGNHTDFAGEVDHAALIERLMDEFHDGWALSCSSPSLKILLPLCPNKVRIMAWTRTYSSFKPGIWPAYSWEPVLLWGGRNRYGVEPFVMTPRDAVICSPGNQAGGGFTGGKPPAFCWWLFDCLGLLPDDEFHDLFPGSGGVWLAWESYRLGLAATSEPAPRQLALSE
jgi:hypothetical protein